MALNFSEPTARVRTVFAQLREEHETCIAIADSVITRRLKAHSVELHACPYAYTDGGPGHYGRINYHAAIRSSDTSALSALREEIARRADECDARHAGYGGVYRRWLAGLPVE